MEIDPRGPRTAALITTAVLAAVLITGSSWLLAVQALVFAAGAVFGLRYSPNGVLYRTLVRPRLGPPRELESEAPPLDALRHIGPCSAVRTPTTTRSPSPRLTRHPRSEGESQ